VRGGSCGVRGGSAVTRSRYPVVGGTPIRRSGGDRRSGHRPQR